MIRLFLAISFALACGDGSNVFDGGVFDGNRDTSMDGGACDLDTSNDPNNCGACGRVCPHRSGTIPTCSSGACTYRCLSGFGDCNADLHAPSSDGCEVDLDSDPTSCGSCGNVCPGGVVAHTDGACVSGACQVGCEAGWADCNLDLSREGSDGCEAQLAVDVDHCGSCRNACASGCDAGVCEGTSLACSFFADTIAQPVSLRLAAHEDGVLVVWNDRRRLYVARLDAQGREVGEPMVLVEGFQSHWRFDVGWNGDRYAIVHEDEDANLTWVTHVRGDGRVDEPRMVAVGPVASISVTDADGGVTAVLGTVASGSSVHWITSDQVERGPGVGEFAPHAARAVDGFAAIGHRTQPPTVTRPWESFVLEHGSLDAALGVRSAPSVVGSDLDVLSGQFDTSLTAFGSGALAVVRMDRPIVGGFSLYAVRFDERGEIASGPVAIPGSLNPTLFDVVGDEAGGWLAYGPDTSSTAGAPLTVRRIGPSGSFGAATTAATARAGSVKSINAAATSDGVVVFWRWRGLPGSDEMHAIEGVFVRRDGTVVRPCD